MPHYARRYQLEGNLLYHVLNRANAGFIIFHEDEDYRCFIAILLTYSKEKRIKIYHYCIMPTHYHLLLELADPYLLSAAMAGINKSYSVYHHKIYKTMGFLWQGRFKSKPIQKDDYMLTCGRYIERNPVAAGIVSRPEDYPYSSARYYISGRADNLIHEDPFYEGFGANIYERRKNYQNFLSSFDAEEEKIYSSFEAPVGDPIFISKLCKEQGRYLPRRQGRPRTQIFFP